VTTLNDALGRDVRVLSAPAIFRRENPASVLVERALLLLHYDLDGVYLRDTQSGQLTDAYGRWMEQMGFGLVDDIHADPPGTGWTLRQGGSEYVVESAAAGEPSPTLIAGVGDFPPRWWYLAGLQRQVALLATNMACGPVLRSWRDGDEIHDWMEAAAQARRVWGGMVRIDAQLPPSPRPHG